jgi:hypothetical protein
MKFLVQHSSHYGHPSATITPTYVPTVNPFHEKWNSILLADRVGITTERLTIPQKSIWVWDNPTPFTNERTKSIAQRPRFHEGIFYGEKLIAIPLRPKGDSLIGIYEGKSIELKILNYLSCEIIFDNMIMTCVRLR